ncbi:MAG TPA: exodeoxyribonuclease VII large subunit [Opitutaceae bacterium]|nr:exodeoxyribonuclease VII large subunit [Opitutaceae bacterium]
MPPASIDLGSAGPEARPLTVTEFTRRVKEVLEGAIGPCWVRGEVSNLRVQPSGHVYFSLKDAGAQLAAVMFRTHAARQAVKLRDGLQVVAFGDVGVYEPQGKYQLVVKTLVADGVGALQREYEALKRRLSDEGLFDPQRKKPIPQMPGTVGFLTSPTGAAVQDFMRILIRRGWRGRAVVLPAKVQGEGAADEMAGMLRLAEALGIFDLIVIGRGGGSIEDLWAFNEEPLVRAVAACRVPTISAVGHEIDFTLCDFAADLRAETPSAAAELISSEFVRLAERTESARQSALGAVSEAMSRARERVAHGRSRLRLLSPAALVERGYLRLDDMTNRLASALRSSLQVRVQRLSGAAARLERASPQTRAVLYRQRLLSLEKRILGASPGSVLNRGFAIVRDDRGRPVIRRAAIRPGQRLEAEFADGRTPLRAEQS